MKICIIKPESLTTGGGAEKWIVSISKCLSLRHQVSIVGVNYNETRRTSYQDLVVSLQGIGYHELRCFRLPRGVPLPTPSQISRLLDALNSCDVAYVVGPNDPFDALFTLLKPMIRCTLIAGLHGFSDSAVFLRRMYFPVFRWSLRSFDAFHALNSQTYRWLKMCGFNNVFLIPNGIDTSAFQVRQETEASPIFNVLFTGRLTSDKGADLIADIIRLVEERISPVDIRFVITGTGPLEHMVEDLARHYPNVKYLGFVEEEKLPELIAGAQLYVKPSRTEGMPLSLLEAQACGLPALGSRILGISDVVLDGTTGSLFRVGDTKGFADGIEGYYHLWRNSRAEYSATKNRIREHILRNFDWHSRFNELEAMLESCRGLHSAGLGNPDSKRS